VCRSPELIAAYHGLPRLCVPRHPPHAFARLTTLVRVKQSTRASKRDDENRRHRDDSLPNDLHQYRLSNSGRRWPLPREGPATTEYRCESGCRDERQTVRTFDRDCRVYSSLRKGGDPAAGSPTATLLRLRPSHPTRLRRLGPLRVPAPTSGAPSFHGVTGGVYKARERIHRGVADPRLLAIPASCSRVADCNPN
jgi:hypothetical protein